MTKRFFSLGCFIALFTLTAFFARAETKLPSILGSHMVLQRGEAFPIWGWDDAGTEVTPALLRECGLIRSKAKLVKILARGAIETVLTVKAHKFSKKATEKIAEAGGQSEVVTGDGSSESKPD